MASKATGLRHISRWRHDVLTITLAGVPGSGKAALAAALAKSLQASGSQAAITLNANATLAPDLASHDLILLMGLMADASAAGQIRQAADQRIREALAESRVPYQVLYGLPAECLAQAQHACNAWFESGQQNPPTTPPRPTQAVDKEQRTKSAWVWLCDTCSDPVCEHRLLTDLLARRSTG